MPCTNQHGHLQKIEHMVKLQVLGNNSKTVNNIKTLTWGKNDQHIKIYLPCNFEVNLITHLGVIALFSSIFFLILILFVLYFKNYLEIDVKFKLQKCAACQDLPTLQFWSKSHYPFWLIMQIRKKGEWNLKKIFSSETTEPISTKLCWNDPWVVPFQNCVRQRRSVSKMAAITKK